MKRTRITLGLPGDANAANIWAKIIPVPADNAAFTVTPERTYPDLHPAVGWVVTAEGKSLVVESVEGNALLCRGVS